MPRGRNKEKLLECGLDIMYRQGFNGTGVQQITDAAGVPKGSFYNYFDSKEAFVIQVLELYTAYISAHLETALIKGKGSPLNRMRSLFRDWRESLFGEHGGRGCFAGNLSQEFANQNPTVRRALDRAFAKLEAYYTACLEEAQAAGEIDESKDPKLLAAFIYNSNQGALVRAKALGNTKPLLQFEKIIFEKLLA